MKLFWCPKTRAFRAVWMLEELGRDYERILIDVRDEESRADPEFRSASPMGKVPALIDGDVRIWDSGAICVYLADKYPDAGLGVPIDHPDRGAFLMWTMYTNSVIEPAMVAKFSNLEPNPGQHGFGTFDLMLETLTTGLKDGPWILGEQFTAADILLGTSIHFMETFGILEANPTLTTYLDRCRDRPAFQRALTMEAEEGS